MTAYLISIAGAFLAAVAAIFGAWFVGKREGTHDAQRAIDESSRADAGRARAVDDEVARMDDDAVRARAGQWVREHED